MWYLIFVFFIFAITPSIENPVYSEDFVTPNNDAPIANDEKVNVRKNLTTLKDLLPSRKFCGRQHFDDYLHGSEDDTDITVFPWTALLLYSTGEPIVTCIGSLINARYVLTLASCLRTYNGPPVGVRLGDYNIYNDTDCITHRGIVQCSTFSNFATEKVILHPQFLPEKLPDDNDIGLIRLNQTVHYTDYIRPICLPLPNTKRPQSGDILVVSYWQYGYNFENKSLEDVIDYNKRQVYINLTFPKELCKSFLDLTTELTLCGSLTGNTRFFGNTPGSPLMSYKKRKLIWTLEGIALEDIFSIFVDTLPRVYTRVESYLDWLEENMEP